MKMIRQIMGMPIIVEVVDTNDKDLFEKVFAYFNHVDDTFSTYKETSEITHINKGKLHADTYSEEMQEILLKCEETKTMTNGYFDIQKNGKIDPSGLVKGWAVQGAASLLKTHNSRNFYVDAGGDIQTSGLNEQGTPWRIGIRNPFTKDNVVKVVHLSGEGIATSGTYERGAHVYNPHDSDDPLSTIVSLTVISESVYDADRFATAAFAMQKEGIYFIEQMEGLEGYSIDANGIATQTTHFEKYVHST